MRALGRAWVLLSVTTVGACCCPPPSGASLTSPGASLRFQEGDRRPEGSNGQWCYVNVTATAGEPITRFTLVSAYAQDTAGTVLDTSTESITSLGAGQSQVLEFHFMRTPCSQIQTVRVESR
ncbi:MAG: hypothetical protein IT379_39320 [Deltaproteobacteria bacterium]|nr:hypothetical protein [Deltaproteobacteria bacterium]